MKTAIVVITYNISIDIFVLQMEAIKKFCKDNFTIEVFDNSSEDWDSDSIQYHAIRVGAIYRKTNSTHGPGSDSHAFAANLSYSIIKNSYDALLYLDHDCIPFKDFTIESLLDGKEIGGIGQHDKYVWPGCFALMNQPSVRGIVDFRPNNELGLDTGGNLYKTIDYLGKERCAFFTEEYCQNRHFDEINYGHYSVIQKTFMHFVGASNWMGIKENEKRLSGLISIAKEKTGL